MKRILLIGLIMITVAKLYAQTIATTFFPQFVSYSQKPVVNYGDEIAGSPWNDPCVLKKMSNTLCTRLVYKEA